MNPRKPTDEEKKQLAGFHLYDDYLVHTDEDEQEANEDVEQAAIAVFDKYSTSGYKGKIAVVVWSKSYLKAYMWDENDLIHSFD